MNDRPYLLLVLLSATLVLALAVATASAARLASTSETFRAGWRSLNVGTNLGIAISCPVTLEGTLHSRTIAKTSGNLIGYVTRALVSSSNCTGGTLRVLTEALPWHVRYVSFAGTLPNITGITVHIIDFSAQFCATFFGSTVCCLYRTSATEPGIFTFNREASGLLTSVTAGGRISKSPSSQMVCEDVILSGTTTTLTALSSTQRITVTLVA
jgi:hypothetical protein